MEVIITFLLPDLFISQPESGSEINRPTGRANNTMPNSASDKFNFCRMLGMRDAQLEKQRPAKKNKEPTAILFINLELFFFNPFKMCNIFWAKLFHHTLLFISCNYIVF